MLRIIDTETCGLQEGSLRLPLLMSLTEKSSNPASHLVRPDRPISPQAMAIHRITEAMVADKPWIEDVIPHYYGSEWSRTTPALTAAYCLRCPVSGFAPMKLARRLWPGSAQQYGVI